jgi:autotransporter-associated beta strand protein
MPLRWKTLLFVTSLCAVSVGPRFTQASAVNYSVFQDASLYGHLWQLDIPDPAFNIHACGPVSAVNSYVYLQNVYPTIYGHKLVPDTSYSGLISLAMKLGDSTTDYMKFMNLNYGMYHAQYITGQLTYMEEVSPGVTAYSAIDDQNWTGVTPPSFVQTAKNPTWQSIYNGLRNNNVVDLLFWGNYDHFIGVTGFQWLDANGDGTVQSSENAFIAYMDPYTGTTGTAQIFQNSTGGLMWADYSNPQYSGSAIYIATELTLGPTAAALASIPPSTAYWHAGSGTWSSSGVWTVDQAGTVPATALPAATSNVFFATTAGTATVDQNYSVNSLTLSVGTAMAINGTGTLTLVGSAGVGLSDNGAAAHTINAPLALAALQTWNVSGANPLTVTGTIRDAAGASGLTLSGGGTLILANTNSYTGGTTISAATLQLGDGLGRNGSVAGNVSDNGLLRFANPAAQSYSGTVSGSGGVVAAGAGALTFTGSQTYTGGTTVAGNAALQLGDGALKNGSVAGNVVNNGLVTFANPSALSMTGTITGTGGVTKTAAGRLVLTAASGYSGGTSVSGGTLQYGIANALPTAGAVTVNGGQLDLGTNSGAVGAVTLTSGAITGGTLTGTRYNVQSGTASANLGGSGSTLLKNGTGTVTLTSANTYAGGTTVSGGTLNVIGSLAENGPQKVFIGNNGTSFGPALVRAIPSGGNYAGYGATIDGDLGTTAELLYGTSTGTHALAMQWRQRTADDISALVASDVLNLSGMSNSGEQTDTFVLSMSYDPNQLVGGAAAEDSLAAHGLIYLISKDSDEKWANAVKMNFGVSIPDFRGVGPWTSADTTLGEYGVDTNTHTVWAVLNHNSEFSVVPEPSSLALVGVAALGLFGCAWRYPRRPDRKSVSHQDLFEVEVISIEGEVFVRHARVQRMAVVREAQRRAA